MPRISVSEQYDNRDVIAQIYKLKDDIDSIGDQQTQIDELSEKVDTFQGAIDQANSTALQAVQQAQDAICAVTSRLQTL